LPLRGTKWSLSWIRQRYSRGYLTRRLGNLVIIFIVILLFNFLLPRLMPGSFASVYLQQLQQDVGNISPQAEIILVARMEHLLGLNEPLYVQFIRYLQGLASFPPDFGPSFEFYPSSAWQLIITALPWTLTLVGLSQIIAWVIGIFVGVGMALRKGGRLDRILQPINISLLTVPRFWLAILFIIVFAIDLRWLPAATAYSIYPTIPSILVHMILPLSVLVITTVPSHVLVMRSAALEVLSSDFVTAMKAQGLGSRMLLRRVLKNSLLPSVTALFLSFGDVIGGVYVIEYTFSYPGLGSVLANAVFARDFPVLQASLFITVIVVLIANLAADLVYPLIDPRVAYT
jgi:peptide/nickel transport system permease protein